MTAIDVSTRSGRPVRTAWRLRLLLALAIAGLLTGNASAVDTSRTAPTGNWSGGGWSDGEPTSDVNARVNGVTVAVDQVGEICWTLYLDGTASQAGTLEVSDGSIKPGNSIYVGDSGFGEVRQTGGSVLAETYANNVVLGNQATGNGTYRLEGGLMKGYFNAVGKAGAGLFLHTGGTHEALSDLTLGDAPGSQGEYHLGGTGQLSVKWFETIGRQGAGRFYQTDGTNTTTWLTLGDMAGGSGTFELSGGQVTAGSLSVGSFGNGSFLHTGGTVAAGGIRLADAAGSQGTYDLQGPAQVTAGYLTVAAGGTGTFSQAGGSVSVTGNLYIADGAGSNGTYTFSGVQLTVGDCAYVGNRGSGTFTHTAGTHTVTDYLMVGGLSTAGSCAYNLSGTGQLTTKDLYVGGAGEGGFTQTAGTVTVGNELQVGRGTARGGYNLTGGTLQMTRGSWLYIGATYGVADAVFNLGDATSTGAIVEIGTGGGVPMTICRAGGMGTLRGWGTVALAGRFENNGRAIADGYGTDRALDLSSFSSVVGFTVVPSISGWFAQNRGKLILPAIVLPSRVRADFNTVWGAQPLMVNSVEVGLWRASGSGPLAGSLLAPDRAEVPPAGSGTILGLWDFTPPPGLTVDAADFIFRYDDVLAASKGIDESAIRAYRYADGRWWDVTTRLNLTDKQVMAGALHGFSPLAVGVGLAAPNQWQGEGAGSWRTPALWTDGLVPDEPTVTAHFLDRPAGSATVTVDDDVTVGSLDFDSPRGYTIQGPGAIRLKTWDAGRRLDGRARIDVRSGDHVVNCPIVAEVRTNITVSGGSLTLAGSMSGINLSVSTLGTGRLRLADDWADDWVTTSYLIDVADTSEVSLVGSAAQVLSICLLTMEESAPGQPTGRVDIGQGRLIVNYDAGGAGPLASIRDWIRAGYNRTGGGDWGGQGITSSAAAGDAADLTAVGVFDNSDPLLGGRTDFEGIPVDASSVLVKYTYWGDADFDGKVTFDDYDIIDYYYWFPLPAAQMGWWTGDFDYDGNVDFDDYDKIDYAYWFQGAPLAGGLELAGVVAPEPATLALLTLGGLATLLRRKRLCHKAM